MGREETVISHPTWCVRPAFAAGAFAFVSAAASPAEQLARLTYTAIRSGNDRKTVPVVSVEKCRTDSTKVLYQLASRRPSPFHRRGAFEMKVVIHAMPSTGLMAVLGWTLCGCATSNQTPPAPTARSGAPWAQSLNEPPPSREFTNAPRIAADLNAARESQERAAAMQKAPR